MPAPKPPRKPRKSKKAAEMDGGPIDVPEPVVAGNAAHAATPDALADAIRDEAAESAIQDGPRAVRVFTERDLQSIEIMKDLIGIEVSEQLDDRLDDAQLDARHNGNRLVVTGPDDDDSDRAADLFNMRQFALEMLPAVADIVGSFAEQGEDKDGHEEWKVARVPLGYEDDIGDFLRATLRMGKVIADAVTAGIEGGSE